ncbi:hypothetical protein GCK72_017249 [Caenorhabditis remanei]|uniref:Acyl_transf_3 domain-containing protein n=1 Tax=Caenorhabditis remanei TaxID=31234 RepID=A0A6A5G6K4_CAERE|nr:hypothetical protein GCK72_017249 [Caenorhabditis remanei]KAF1750698.1 hypothetical protein GCK72_017249 [Caenorhabditis remanei]
MREDIQCLRGIAIIFVLLFHLCPNLFVNGFLGVDIFFVISGFLMAKNLTKAKLVKIHDFLLFYYMRFRRILPMYFLAVFMTVVMVHLFLGDFLWKNNNRYSLASLLMVTNQLVIHDQADYFNEFFASTSSINGFLHLWSLSLEMQFYLFVPIIFFGLQFLKHDYLKLITVSLITIFGYIAFAMILDKFAFNFMFLRLWQFSAGFMALFWSKIQNSKELPKKSDTESESPSSKCPFTKNDIVTISLCILSLCLLPREVEVLVLRPVVTLATALIIASESQGFQILKSDTLCYIGDISYVMYLVHWPVISIFLASTVKSYIFCILTIFIASILLHHLFEKQYLKLNMKGVFPLIFLLIAANSYLQYSIRNDTFWKNDFPAETRQIIDQNLVMYTSLWDLEARKDKCIETDIETPFPKGHLKGYCRYPRGHGNFSIMMLGNSYVLNLEEHMRAHFNYNYSDYRYMSVIASYGLYSDHTLLSQQALEFSKQQVENHKPDVLFIVARYMENIKDPIQVNDPLTQQINETIAFYEKFVKKLYILDAHPKYHENFLNLFLHYAVTRPDDMEVLHLDKKQADDEMRPVKRRFSKIKCNKCQFFDLSRVFLLGDKYLTYDKDTMLSYVDNSVHLTGPGVKKCEPVFQKVAREIMDSI